MAMSNTHNTLKNNHGIYLQRNLSAQHDHSAVATCKSNSSVWHYICICSAFTLLVGCRRRL